MSNNPISDISTTGLSDSTIIAGIAAIKTALLTNATKNDAYAAALIVGELTSKLRSLGI